MTVASATPHDFPDQSVREQLHNRKNLEEAVRKVHPGLADKMDFSRAEYLKREFLTEDWRGRECDILVQIPYRESEDAQEILVIILLEHQSDSKRIMLMRILLYAVFYWDRQWFLWSKLPTPRPKLVFTPIVPMICYTGEDRWESIRRLS